VGHGKLARVRSIAQTQELIQANNTRSMTASGGGGRVGFAGTVEGGTVGGEMVK